MTLHSAFLNLTHVKILRDRRERERGARRKTLYRINSTCSFQARNWTHEKCRFTLQNFYILQYQNRLSTVVHFSRPFNALSSKWLPSFLHTCVILCIPLLCLLSDNILYAHSLFIHPLPPLLLFLTDTKWTSFIHLIQLDSACRSKQVSKLVFYAQSTSAVISGRSCRTLCTESVKAE